ncbi:unnamed protein product [Acanthosepion pharaonis]|uniref:Uncharacterized protein n=1 Tax=Acanthosepion pharaonis TaxID=158019 RepID=A0A812CCH5_ACAPH|nr:unnamed protein product [Sepia pharaonis]
MDLSLSLFFPLISDLFWSSVLSFQSPSFFFLFTFSFYPPQSLSSRFIQETFFSILPSPFKCFLFPLIFGKNDLPSLYTDIFSILSDIYSHLLYKYYYWASLFLPLSHAIFFLSYSTHFLPLPLVLFPPSFIFLSLFCLSVLQDDLCLSLSSLSSLISFFPPSQKPFSLSLFLFLSLWCCLFFNPCDKRRGTG